LGIVAFKQKPKQIQLSS